MFIEEPENIRKHLMINVDVYSKIITDAPMQERSEKGCMKAIMHVKPINRKNNHNCQATSFDCNHPERRAVLEMDWNLGEWLQDKR